jgi:hypothetical protein
MQWQGLIHEELKALDGQITTPILLQGDCLHYSYDSIESHYKQTEKFSTLSAESLNQKGVKANFIKLLLAPLFKFIQMFFFKLGILDGYYGFVVCKISAQATYQKYAKLKALNQQQ